MATTPRTSTRRAVQYPTSDGKPMAETDIHRQDMADLIEILKARYAADPMVYVSGNLLLFYEEGNRRRHIAPDVFVVFGRPKLPLRDHYLVWREGKAPDVVIELTSKTTRREDQHKKWELYRDVLKVPEYFLFDPTSDWLKPSLQGHRLVEGRYVAIEPIEGGLLPSAGLGLCFVRRGQELRLVDCDTRRPLPTPQERAEAENARADAEQARADAEQARADAAAERAEIERERAEIERERADLQRERADLLRGRAEAAEAENARLLREIEAMRRPGGNGA